MVVLITICKKYGKYSNYLSIIIHVLIILLLVKYLSSPAELAELAVEMRSHFPPSPASHSLGLVVVEKFTVLISALETLFKTLILSPSVTDEYRWKVFEEFKIVEPQEISLEEVNSLHTLEKLQYLNSLVSAPFEYSEELQYKINNEVIHWIMNGFQLFTSDILYSSNQLSKACKTPLYTKTFLAVASFIARSNNGTPLNIALPWIFQYLFHPHFLCNLIASDIWYIL